MKQRSGVNPSLLLIAAGLFVYSNTFSSSFQFDDIRVIVNNPAVHHLNIAAIWNAFNTRFLVGLSLALNYVFGGLDVTGYHAFNISIHILTSLMVYFFVSLLFKTPRMTHTPLLEDSEPVALFAAAIFLTHPIQTQAVTYIWQRAACMSALFYLASLALYIRSRIRSSKSAYAISLACAVMGMFSKETAITLPFTILLVEILFFEGNKRQRAMTLLPFFLTLPIIPLMLTRTPHLTLDLMKPDFAATGGPKDLMGLTRFVNEKAMDRTTYWLTQLNVLRTYLRLSFLPAGQNLDYDYPLSHNILEYNVLFSLACLAALFSAGILLIKKHRLMTFAIFWFFITMSVESFVIQADVIFEHRLYLPMAGIAIFFSSGLYYFFSKKNLRDAAFGTTLSICLILSFFAFERNKIWRSELSLWDDTVSKSPKKPRAHFNRGQAYEELGRYEEALMDYNKTLELDPDYAVAYNNRGNTYNSLGKPDLAIDDFNRTLALITDAKIYNNRGISYGQKGNYDKAIADFTKAIDLDGDLANAYENRALAYHEKGLAEQALKDLNKARSLQG